MSLNKSKSIGKSFGNPKLSKIVINKIDTKKPVTYQDNRYLTVNNLNAKVNQLMDRIQSIQPKLCCETEGNTINNKSHFMHLYPKKDSSFNRLNNSTNIKQNSTYDNSKINNFNSNNNSLVLIGSSSPQFVKHNIQASIKDLNNKIKKPNNLFLEKKPLPYEFANDSSFNSNFSKFKKNKPKSYNFNIIHNKETNKSLLNSKPKSQFLNNTSNSKVNTKKTIIDSLNNSKSINKGDLSNSKIIIENKSNAQLLSNVKDHRKLSIIDIPCNPTVEALLLNLNQNPNIPEKAYFFSNSNLNELEEFSNYSVISDIKCLKKDKGN